MQIECDDSALFSVELCQALWCDFLQEYRESLYPKMQECYTEMQEKTTRKEATKSESFLSFHATMPTTNILDSMQKENLQIHYTAMLESWQNIAQKDQEEDQDSIYAQEKHKKDSNRTTQSMQTHNMQIYDSIQAYFCFLCDYSLHVLQKDFCNVLLNLHEIRESARKNELYIELLFTNNATMQNANKEYMGKDYATDVLSFPLLLCEGAGMQCLGSILINMYAVCDRAEFYKHNIYAEISLLFIHAFLHLLGFDHENDSGLHRAVENHIIESLCLPTSLIVRVE